MGFVISQLVRSSREQRLWRLNVSNWVGGGRGAGGWCCEGKSLLAMHSFCPYGKGVLYGPSEVTIVTMPRRKDFLDPVPSYRRSRFSPFYSRKCHERISGGGG